MLKTLVDNQALATTLIEDSGTGKLIVIGRPIPQPVTEPELSERIGLWNVAVEIDLETALLALESRLFRISAEKRKASGSLKS